MYSEKHNIYCRHDIRTIFALSLLDTSFIPQVKISNKKTFTSLCANFVLCVTGSSENQIRRMRGILRYNRMSSCNEQTDKCNTILFYSSYVLKFSSDNEMLTIRSMLESHFQLNRMFILII